jgi:hypothetical protein
MLQRRIEMVSPSSSLPPCSDPPLPVHPVPRADIFVVVSLGHLGSPSDTHLTGTCSGSQPFLSPFENRRP